MRRPPLPKSLSPGWPKRFSWALYILILWEILLRAENPDLAADDSGEMIAGSFALGLPHPPGYPLFDLVGRIFSWLPLGSPAFRYNLLSAFFVLGAVLLTAWTVLDLAEKNGLTQKSYPRWLAPGLAMAAGFVLFTNQNLFAQALSAKGAVYTLTLLLVSFFAAWRVRQDHQALTPKQKYLLLFLWALGLANHWQTVLLFIPFLIHWFWTSRWALSPKRAVWALTALFLGISPYLYLPLRSGLHPLPCWGNPVSPTGFLWVVSRKLVQGSESFLPGFVFWGHSLSQVLENRFLETLPGFGILALAGLFLILKNRTQWGMGLTALYAPLLIAVSLVRESQDIGFLLNVFLVSVSGLWVLFGFWGLFILMGGFSKPKNSWLLTGVGILVLMGLVFWGWSVFKAQDKSDYTLADDFGKNALRQIPRSGLLVAGGDPYVMPIFYDQFVLGLRPDLLFVPDIFLVHDWGWEQIARQRPDWDRGWTNQKTLEGRWNWLLSKAQTRGGAYYALGIRYLEPLLSQGAHQWAAAGLSSRWLAPGSGASFSQNEVMNELRSERTRGLSDGQNFTDGDFSTLQIRHYYADQFFQAAQESPGLSDIQLQFWDKGLCFNPMNASACNHLARELVQAGNWELAIWILKQGLSADPTSVPCWFNLRGIYARAGWDAKAGDCYRRLTLIGWSGSKAPSPAGWSKLKVHPAAYYSKLSRRYKDLGLSFLTQKSFEMSEMLSRDPSGAAL
jgi:hypothetical protein